MEKTSGFGIGEAGKAPASTAVGEIEAARLQPAPVAEMMRCSHCGEMFPRKFRMSASGGTVCPDCYDECSE